VGDVPSFDELENLAAVGVPASPLPLGGSNQAPTQRHPVGTLTLDGALTRARRHRRSRHVPVAAQLALQGWPAALTTTGTPRTDLLAQVGDKLAAAIQVKTKTEHSKRFEVTAIGSAAARYANEWVVLVSLAADSQHEYFVLPRDVVFATVQANRIVFNDPPRIRMGPEEYAHYRNEWNLLQTPSWEAPWHLRAWVFNSRDRITWPDGHPGVPEDTEVHPNT
jgi:hypothetical protein